MYSVTCSVTMSYSVKHVPAYIKSPNTAKQEAQFVMEKHAKLYKGRPVYV